MPTKKRSGGGRKSPHEFTSSRVASKAGRTLRDPKASRREKSIAGSALTQARDRRKKR